MSLFFQFIKESLVSALAGYGVVSLATVAFTALGSATNLWFVVPAVFTVQMALKFVFSRDSHGRLRSTS